MASVKHLPVVDEFGFYEIRFDSIGGLGAHLAGQILGEAAALNMGLNALHFSSYGSEKKGSPIKSFLRFAGPDKEIRSCSPVERPHMVAVFHDALLKTPGGLQGLRKKGILIINSRKSLKELKAFGLPDDCYIYLIDALTISIEERSRVNTAMMGAVAKASGFLDSDEILKALSATFASKHPAAVKGNEKTFIRGTKELKLVAKPGNSKNGGPEPKLSRPGPKFGYLTAPIGGCITEAGNSVMKNMSSSRQGFIPSLDLEKCVHCGICDLVCPDYCFVWGTEPAAEKGKAPRTKLKGIDYNYCKGCMRCVDSCPSGALTKETEEEGSADKHRTPMFPETRK
ncbi:MAG: 2-oxoacid:acceptor oxidoreductase family protein [Elusimicrobiota bacterium]